MQGREAIDQDRHARLSPNRRGWAAYLLRAVRRCMLTLTALAALFMGGFVLFAHHIGALAPPQEPQSADAIIVLTGGQSRIDAALDLLRSGKGRRLLISGVNPMADADDLRAATGAEKTLFNCCVDIDHAALDTVGNAEESAKWMQANAYDSVIVVTSNYHMPRSLLEMRRHVQAADVQPYPVVNTPIATGDWLTKPHVLRLLFKEYTKFLAALARSILPTEAVKPADQNTLAARSTATTH